MQELKEQQRQRGDSQYLTAISAALGQKTTNTGTQTATQTQTGSTHTSGEQSSMQNTASTQKENTEGIQSLSLIHIYALPRPAYTVRVQVQKKNPSQIQADNEFLMQVVKICAEYGQPLPPEAVIRLMEGRCV